MKNNNVLFAIIILLMTILTAITFVGSRLLFANQPGIEDVISLVWTVALVIVLYKLIRYTVPTKDVSRQEWRQNMYGSLVFMCEVLAVMVVVVLSLIFGNLVTAGQAQTPMLLAIGALIVLAVVVPGGVRLIRTINRQSLEG